jgi:ribulose-5-phosphate 4-epimerase/fuculose-1-phosphate aldolase
MTGRGSTCCTERVCWGRALTSGEAATGRDEILGDLVSANRILGHEGILDAYGHVSARHPGAGDVFLLSRARAPGLVTGEDVVEFSLTGEPLTPSGRPLYLERYIHAAIYAARPDVVSVCHSHTPSILPFSVSLTPLRSVIHNARHRDWRSGVGSRPRVPRRVEPAGAHP